MIDRSRILVFGRNGDDRSFPGVPLVPPGTIVDASFVPIRSRSIVPVGMIVGNDRHGPTITHLGERSEHRRVPCQTGAAAS